jgi:hypothetical protein
LNQHSFAGCAFPIFACLDQSKCGFLSTAFTACLSLLEVKYRLAFLVNERLTARTTRAIWESRYESSAFSFACFFATRA